MNSENESFSTSQPVNNFVQIKDVVLITLLTIIFYGGSWIGQKDTEIKYSRQENQLNSKIMQHENSIENLSREIERLQGSKKIITKKDAEIKKLKNELSTEQRQSDCYKKINAQINQLKEEERKRYGPFETYAETLTKKQARDAEKEAYRIDKLDEQLTVLYEQLGGCNN